MEIKIAKKIKRAKLSPHLPPYMLTIGGQHYIKSGELVYPNKKQYIFI